MGFELRRFNETVDEELICPICRAVLQDPLQVRSCEHAFCAVCIHEWLERSQTCPIDRSPIEDGEEDLISPPRILRNLLGRLEIECDNAEFGCEVRVRLDNLDQHVRECEFSPKKPVCCEMGCGFVVAKDELKNHNCIKDLRSSLDNANERIGVLESEVVSLRHVAGAMQREVHLLKECIRVLQQTASSNSPRLRELQTELEKQDMMRWANGLSVARVLRWGGMISTPDSVLQSLVKRALLDSGCPSMLAAELVENSHERRWPSGLSSLETRQLKRRHYAQYFCRRVPSKQAVVVLAADNQHMPEDMILDPGIVMIFAHGVE